MAISDLEDLGILLGVTAFGIVLISFITGISFILRSREGKKLDIQRLFTGFAIIGLGAPWLGGMSQFIMIVLTGEALELKDQAYISGWGPALAASLWIFLVFSLFKIEYRNIATGIISIFGIVFLLFNYILLPGAETETNYQGNKLIVTAEGIVKFTISDDSKLPDHQYIGIPGLIILLYLFLTIFFVGGFFLWASRATASDEIRWKARLVGIGIVIYGLFTPIDALIADIPFVIILARTAVGLSFILIWIGYTLPTFFRKKVNLIQS